MYTWKKWVCMALTALVLFSFSGCNLLAATGRGGNNREPVSSTVVIHTPEPTPTLAPASTSLRMEDVPGYYVCTGAVYQDAQIAAMGEWLELYADGTYTLNMFDVDYPGVWSIHKKDGGYKLELTENGSKLVYTGVYTVDEIAINIASVDYVFQRSDAPAATPTPAPSGYVDDISQEKATKQYFEGDWYGYWRVTDGRGSFESWSNSQWDCCARFSVDGDKGGYFILWDEDLPIENAVSEFDFELHYPYTERLGVVSNQNGYFLDMQLDSDMLTVDADPYAAVGLTGYIEIAGTYEDAEGSFSFCVCLRPWGTDWTKDSSLLPFGLPKQYYFEWYEPLVVAGKPMPDHIGEE